MKHAKSAVYCSGLLLGSAFPGLALYAAETAASDDTLGEIIVTAEKRAESVQSVPVSITVLPSEELARQGVQTIADLSRMSASLEFTASSAAPGGGAFIRGIGTESVGGDTTTASVSVVLDGVVLGNTNVTDIFDVSRVEVLKGPQGTLFGSSVSAGVISLVTNAPDPSAMSATVSAEYGAGDLGSQYDRRSLRAVLNLPLTADSAVRISLHSDDNSNVFYNPYQNVQSDNPDNGARIRYLLKATDALTFNVIADYNKSNSTGAPVLLYRDTLPATGAGLVGLRRHRVDIEFRFLYAVLQRPHANGSRFVIPSRLRLELCDLDLDQRLPNWRYGQPRRHRVDSVGDHPEIFLHLQLLRLRTDLFDLAGRHERVADSESPALQ
jgi:outer membrane receptor protein involved in Fe transport